MKNLTARWFTRWKDVKQYSDLKNSSVSGLFWLLTKFGDGLMKMQIVNIQVGGRQ